MIVICKSCVCVCMCAHMCEDILNKIEVKGHYCIARVLIIALETLKKPRTSDHRYDSSFTPPEFHTWPTVPVIHAQKPSSQIHSCWHGGLSVHRKRDSPITGYIPEEPCQRLLLSGCSVSGYHIIYSSLSSARSRDILGFTACL